MSVLAAAATWPGRAGAREARGVEAGRQPAAQDRRLRKVATEEAFTVPEVADAVRAQVARGGASLDLALLRPIYDAPGDPARSAASQAAGASPDAASRDALARTLLPRRLDIDRGRLGDMDANDVDLHVLSLGMPGVQMFDRDTAVSLARISNDRLAEAVRRHPTRFAGLACSASQDPSAATKEMERAAVLRHRRRARLLQEETREKRHAASQVVVS